MFVYDGNGFYLLDHGLLSFLLHGFIQGEPGTVLITSIATQKFPTLSFVSLREAVRLLPLISLPNMDPLFTLSQTGLPEHPVDPIGSVSQHTET